MKDTPFCLTSIHTPTYMHIHTYVRVSVHIHTHVCVCTHVSVHTRVHAHTPNVITVAGKMLLHQPSTKSTQSCKGTQ